MYVMVRSGFADPETGRKRHLKEQKGEPGRGAWESNSGDAPPHWSFVRLLSHPKHKTHVRTHVDPGRAPRRHPHLRRDPLFTIQNF